MFKSYTAIVFFAAAVIGFASAGLIETHHVVHEPVLAKVGSVVHSAPSAVSHQSITRIHNNAVVEPIVAPVVKTTLHAAAPVLHAAPLVHSVPVVHSAPIVHSVPLVHSAPLVKTILPAAHIIHH